MEVFLQHTGKRGRPVARTSVNGVSVGVPAARLYGLLQAAVSACQASNSTLATQLGVCPETVARALGELEAAGLVSRQYGRLGRTIELVEVRQ